MDWRCSSSRLWMYAQGIPKRYFKEYSTLWGNAPIHPDLRPMDWSSCVRNSGAPFSERVWIIKVWDEQSFQNHFRSPGSQVSSFLFPKTYLCLRRDGTFNDIGSLFGWFLCYLSEFFKRAFLKKT